MEAAACPSREEGRGSPRRGRLRGRRQSQAPGRRQEKQLWLWLLHWAEKGLLTGDNRKFVNVEGSLLPFLPPGCRRTPKAHLHWWKEGPQPPLSWGEVEQEERGPWGARAGTCLEEREAGGPGGSWGAGVRVVEGGGQVVAPDPQVQGVVVTGSAVMPAGRPCGR